MNEQIAELSDRICNTLNEKPLDAEVGISAMVHLLVNCLMDHKMNKEDWLKIAESSWSHYEEERKKLSNEE